MNLKIDRHTMSTADVAQALGLSVERIRQLDDALKPVRKASGQRRYAPEDVEAFARGRKQCL